MKVSVVTVSLNQARYLERALLSVLEQCHDDLEYILVDGGSTDGSVRILDRYRDRLDHLVVGPDGGPADALNKGFALATGEICAYVNADDALLPGAVAQALRRFERDPSADVVYAHGFVVDGEGRSIRRFRSTRFGRRRCAYGSAVIMQQSTFFRRSAFTAVGGFNPENRTCWDGELLLDLALAGSRVVRANEYWSIFTMHAASITGRQANVEAYADDRRRLFVKAMGREPSRLDRALLATARLEKWWSNPSVLAARLLDTVRRPEVAA